MEFSDLVKIGTLGSAIDRDGMIRFKLLPEYLDLPLTDLFLIFKKNKVRYVSVIKEDETHGMRLLLDDTEIMTEAAEEKGVIIALPSNELAELQQNNGVVSYIDYNIVFSDEFIGKIIDEYDNGAQNIITISNGDKEFMIPLVEKYVQEINHDIKQIIVQNIEELRNL